MKATDYVQETAFNFSNDLIFVEVVINEERFNFIFDTGAEANVIGKHIAHEIDYKVISSSKVSATHKSKEKVEFIQIPKISLANVAFENTGAIVADIAHFDKQFGCNSIDGIIGNNLMRKAAWQIDYKNQRITIADNIEKIKVAENASEISMDAGKIRNVFFDVTIDSVAARFIFDTGYNGKIQADSSFFNLLKAKNGVVEYTTNSGISVNDLHGAVVGTTYNTMVKQVDLEGVVLTNQVISLAGNNKYVIGNEIFKNFTLTIDWDNDKLYFEPTTAMKADTLEGYELAFAPNFITRKIEITRFRVEHALEEKINLNAEIVKINEVDVSNFSLDELCAYWERESENLKHYETLDIVVLDEGVLKNIKLTNRVLLPKG